MAVMTLNKHYNFSLYQNSILGTIYEGAKLVSILDYQTALKFANIELLHRQIFSYLPPGTNSDKTQYTYYLFKVNGKDVIVADVWIIATSIIETLGVNYTIRLNNITSTKFTVVRDQLRLLGISFDIL